MEFRSERIKEIRIQLEADVNKRDDILKKYKRIKNILSVICKITAAVTMSTGVGGIISTSTLSDIVPVSITLNCLTVVCSLFQLISTKLHDCVSEKIDKHRDIKLVAIGNLEVINKILAEDETIDQNEFNTISDLYSDFHKSKLEIQNKHKTSIV
jgi:uncharacterized protein YjaG (DUF416 family)